MYCVECVFSYHCISVVISLIAYYCHRTHSMQLLYTMPTIKINNHWFSNKKNSDSLFLINLFLSTPSTYIYTYTHSIVLCHIQPQLPMLIWTKSLLISSLSTEVAMKAVSPMALALPWQHSSSTPQQRLLELLPFATTGFAQSLTSIQNSYCRYAHALCVNDRIAHAQMCTLSCDREYNYLQLSHHSAPFWCS